MSTLLRIVENSKSFQKVLNEVTKSSQVQIYGMVPVARCFLGAYIHTRLKKPIVYISKSDEEAEIIRDDFSTLLGFDTAFLPAWDSSTASPEPKLVSYRMETLKRLISRDFKILSASENGFLQKVVPPRKFKRIVLKLKTEEKIDHDYLIERLVYLGFDKVYMVEEVGEFAVRGSIVDVFPFGYEDPVRIEFFGDEIVSLRNFELVTQRSKRELNDILLLPYRELFLTPEIYNEVKERIEDPLSDGAERNLASIHPDLTDLSEYLPKDTILLIDEDVEISVPELKTVHLTSNEGIEIRTRPHPNYNGEIKLFKEDLVRYNKAGYKTFLLTDSKKQKERLYDLFSEEFPNLIISDCPLNSGFIFGETKVALFVDHQLFARIRRRREKKFKVGVPIDDIMALKKDDICVHIDYGIGRFDGIKKIPLYGRDTECLLLMYADGDKLWVPIENMKYVQRYIGAGDVEPKLTKLGSGKWERTKRKAKKAVQDLTEELLEIYAKRRVLKGYSFSPDSSWQEQLEASFPYTETEDQIKAIEEIKKDMETDFPMDRLVCGEVGYGKTEVAVRTAFKATNDNKQVAVLVPTTILAQQHYNTFRERMKDFPLVVKMLSRFLTRSEQKEVVDGLKEGKVDVVIGTHRLLSNDVAFKDLGLLIVDEEQRFGVRHKEKIKHIRNLVDVLAMSATPIPRTLYMSLVGIRDMTAIETPPKDRLSVVTEVCKWDEKLIVSATLREIERSGQVFFLHNRVESIYSVADYLRRLFPELSVGIAHGQLSESELESVILDFIDQKYDILVTTAIIESGIDMPNVNTIFVNRADRFGLAQLHQLRGRVGRSDRRAYCYFLIPIAGRITEDAKKRLRAIKTFSELGSGFHLALRDLEIRGSGNLLGSKQHGHIVSVGFELYSKLLKEAVERVKGKKVEKKIEPIIRLDTELYIPKDYIEDEKSRIAIYKKLNSILDKKGLKELKEEIRDRFGHLPKKVGDLLKVVEIKLLAMEIGVSKLSLKENRLEIEFILGKEPSEKKIEKLLKKIKHPVEFFHNKGFGIRVSVSQPSLGRVKKILTQIR